MAMTRKCARWRSTHVPGVCATHTVRFAAAAPVAPLAKPRLLIVGKLGYQPLEPDAAHLFFQVVSRRYEKGVVMITSHRTISEWGALMATPQSSTGCSTTATSSQSAATATDCVQSAAVVFCTRPLRQRPGRASHHKLKGGRLFLTQRRRFRVSLDSGPSGPQDHAARCRPWFYYRSHRPHLVS